MPRPSKAVALRLAARDRLVEANLSIVEPIARRVAAQAPSSFELEDLVGAGKIALITAASRYRPAEHGGAPFSAYARMRVRGAMLDTIRRQNYTRAKMTSSIDDDGASEFSYTPSIEAAIDGGRIRAKILAAAAELAEREREVLALHYGQGLTMAEIGAHFGVHPCTASDWHMAAIRGLRALLGVKTAEAATTQA